QCTLKLTGNIAWTKLKHLDMKVHALRFCRRSRDVLPLLRVIHANVSLQDPLVPVGADRCSVAMEMEDTFVQNLKRAAGVLSKVTSAPLLHYNAAAVEAQSLDIFHWQIMDGNLTQNIHKYLPTTGKCGSLKQDRPEPDSDGELSFCLFKLLEELDYQDFIGCEYKPQRSTEAGLDWLRRYWR
uniref:Hydroxypyruvate isomerase n=1 Tax=Sinocyclocheilus anshuiensis TaxID=1608454 RepID=A0A671PIZ7_9TELE